MLWTLKRGSMTIPQARTAIRNYNKSVLCRYDLEKIAIDAYLEAECVDTVTKEDAEALAYFYVENFATIKRVSKRLYNNEYEL